jgi:hypothetical protein
MRGNLENLCSSKLEDIKEIDKFLHTFDQLKLNRSITSNEIKAAKTSPNKEEHSI